MRTKNLWRFQVGVLIAMSIWAMADPLFVATASSLQDLAAWNHGGTELQQAIWSVGGKRMALMIVLLGAGAASLLALFYYTLGRTNQRVGHETGVNPQSLRSMFGLTTLVALWCGLAISYESMAWHGKCLRFAMRIHQLEDMVEPLRSDWPQQDGELEAIGPFMAYPFGQPTTLLLLQAPSVASESVYVSAVERGRSGAIKLQLTGADGGVWLEWHPQDSRPNSFVGGLADQHVLRDAVALGDGWFMVRYDGPLAA